MSELGIKKTFYLEFGFTPEILEFINWTNEEVETLNGINVPFKRCRSINMYFDKTDVEKVVDNKNLVGGEITYIDTDNMRYSKWIYGRENILEYLRNQAHIFLKLEKEKMEKVYDMLFSPDELSNSSRYAGDFGEFIDPDYLLEESNDNIYSLFNTYSKQVIFLYSEIERCYGALSDKNYPHVHTLETEDDDDCYLLDAERSTHIYFDY